MRNRFFFFNFIYLFIYGCVGSQFLCEGFLQLRRAGATLHRGARASHYRGLSCCGAQAPDAQAQQLWLTGPAAPRHVGSSQTRARTRVPCIARQTLNHCATREAAQKQVFILISNLVFDLVFFQNVILLSLTALRLKLDFLFLLYIQSSLLIQNLGSRGLEIQLLTLVFFHLSNLELIIAPYSLPNISQGDS